MSVGLGYVSLSQIFKNLLIQDEFQ